MFVKLLLITQVFVAVSSIEDLEGAKLYAVSPSTRDQYIILYNMELMLESVDVSQRAHVEGREARVVVARQSQNNFELQLNSFGIPFKVLIKDVKRFVAKENKSKEKAYIRYRKSASTETHKKISFTAYNRYAEINNYLDDLAKKYPKHVTVTNMGNSSEGRMIKAIIISTTDTKDKSKPVFISDAGIHAREWIAPAFALYMIHKLVEDITESDLVEKIDWVIIPLLNPDGYEYSHTTSRLWRKTRSIIKGSKCLGVDGNRNFGFQWMVSGSSSNPCSDTYAGPKAFSEPETRYLRAMMKKFRGRQRVYVAIHGYGSYFLYPFGYNGKSTPDSKELNNVGLKVASAIDAASKGSKKYLVGNSGGALNYLASGASDDWAYAKEKIKLSYTLELPGGGKKGFDLPPSKIINTVNETWQGITVLARYALFKAKRT